MEFTAEPTITIANDGPKHWLVTYAINEMEPGESIQVTLRVSKPAHHPWTIQDAEHACLRRLQTYVQGALDGQS